MATATVTILFTDLVGSTALMSRVGETAADELRREHVEVLRRGIEVGGGVEVKNLGDGLMVAFSSAADAVAAAVAMQQGSWQRNRRAEEALEIRVGIAVGDCVEEDGDYFGAPVVQAARLCAAAGPGEVLCTELVRMLAGSRAPAGFESVGALELKGLDAPVPTARVAWSPPADGAADTSVAEMPGRLAMAVAPEFVGREAEFDRLRTAWKAAVEGERQVVLLGGEPGIGKTTLSARLATTVHDEGGVVAYGRSDEDLGIPYQPWVESLTHLVRSTPQAVLDEHLADRGGHLGLLVPALGQGSSGVDVVSDRDADRFVLFGCAVDLLERISAERPVLLVLDDLHWADRQSLQLLRHVVSCGRPMRVLVVGTFRDSEVASGDPLSDLLTALHREQGTERIAMRGLTDVDVRGLLELLAGHELDDQGLALRDAVLAETSGNPFFVREVLRHLAESGAIYQDEHGRWVGDADVRDVGLPVSVTEVIGRRVASLGDDVVPLLTMAAVIGRDFDVPLLGAASGVDEDAVVDACDAAVAAAILNPTDDFDRYSFAHALIERTLYETMSRSRRARAHRSVAEALEQMVGDDPGPRAAELAHHWAEAVRPEDTGRALRYAQLAGDRAAAQLAPDDAARWYARAVELLGADGDPRQRTELLLGLGRAQAQIGDAAHRQTLETAAELADELGATDLLGAAALAACRSFSSDTGTVDEELVGLLRRAAERVGDGDPALQARLLVARSVEQFFGPDLATVGALADEAVDIARRCGDPATLAFVLHRSSHAHRSPESLDTRFERLAEAAEIVAELGDPVLDFDISAQCRNFLLERGDLAAIERFGRRAEEAAQRAPSATARWVLAFDVATLKVIEGDIPGAEAAAEAALHLGIDAGQADAMAIYGAQLAGLRYHQGRMGELLDAMQEAAQALPALGYEHVLTMVHAFDRRVEEVRVALDRVASSGTSVLRRDHTLTTSLASLTEAAVRTGHPVMAALRDEFAPLHDRVVTSHVTVSPAVGYYLGRLEHALGHYEAAERAFAEADSIHRRLRASLLLLYSDVGRAALLADRAGPGDLDEARSLAARVLDASVAGGYGYLEADARTVLATLEVAR